MIILFVMSMSLLEQNHQEGAGAQERYKMLQDVRERYYFAMYKNAATYENAAMYKNETQLEFEAINNEEYKLDGIPEADQHFFLIFQRYKLRHVSNTSSAFQGTAARGTHGRVVVNDAQPVINDTTDLSERLPVINDTTDLSEGLPVINNTTNLSEGLPVINDTSAKMTCVVVFSINV